MQITFSLDISTLKPHQVGALLALVESFTSPFVIPTSDELEAPEPHFIKTSDETHPAIQ